MKRITRLFTLLLVVVMLIGILPVDAAAANTLTPNITSISLYKGEKQAISLKWNGKALKAKSAKWKSSKKAVATVDKNGKITAKKVGTAKITATYKKVKATVTVKVMNPAVSGKLSKTKLSLNKGKTYTLSYSQVTKARKTTTKGIAVKKVKWTTSNKKVATVSKGKITAKGYGTATITGTYNKVKATCVVTVQNPNATVKKTQVHTHTFKTTTTNATCTSNGQIVVSCSSCGAVSSTKTLAKLPHSYKATVTKEPTVAEKGVRTYKCANCGNSYTEDIPCLEIQEMPEVVCQHTYTTKETKPTCKANGSKVTYCTICGYEASSEVLGMLSHSYEGKVTKEATTEETGIKTYTCSGCGDTYTEVIPCLETEKQTEKQTEKIAEESTETEATTEAITEPTTEATTEAKSDQTEKQTETIPETEPETKETVCDHSPKTTEIKATCGAEGRKLTVCETCGATLEDTVIPKLDHNFVTKETKSTCSSQGEKTTYCKDCNYISSVEVFGMLPHVYDSKVTKEPTATEMGIKTYTCKNCKDSYTEEIPTIEEEEEVCQHHYVTQEFPATCTSQGKKITICDLCQDVKSTEVTDKLAHSYVTKETPATCTSAGTKRMVCESCGYVASEETLPLLSHTYKETITLEPTTTTTGLKNYTCTSCGYAYTETLPCLEPESEETEVTCEHDYIAKEVPSTCTSNGSKTVVCKKCGDVKSSEILDMLSHTLKTTVTKKATCTSKGEKTTKCTVCGYVDSVEETDMLDHTYVTSEQKATCKKTGSKKTYCSVCGTVSYEEVTDTIPHTYTSKVTREATTSVTGIKKYTCSVCAYSYSETIPKLATLVQSINCEAQPKAFYINYGLDIPYVVGEKPIIYGYVVPSNASSKSVTWSSSDPSVATIEAIDYYRAKATIVGVGTVTFTATADDGSGVTGSVTVTTCQKHQWKITKNVLPTCCSIGYYRYTCSVCGHVYGGDYTNLADHTYVGKVTTWPTTTKEGVKTYTCSVCGDTYTEVLPFSQCDHEFVTTETPATCTTKGRRVIACSKCGEVDTDEELPIIDHSCETVTKESTCKEYGEIASVCTMCGKTMSSKQLPKKEHDFSGIDVLRQATCETQGLEEIYCVNCNAGNGTKETPALGHTPVVTEDSESTCQSNGKKVISCSVCGIPISEEIKELIPHDYKEEITREATGRLWGIKRFTCSLCGDYYTEKIPQLDVKMQSMTIQYSSSKSTTFTSKNSRLQIWASGILPSDTTNTDVTWSSSNTAVATVESDGIAYAYVRPVANGTAVITATAADGSGVTATCTVTVEFPDPNVIYIAGGELIPTKTWIHAEDLPEGMDISNVTYEVQDSAGVLAEYGGSLVDDIGGYAMYSGYGARIGTAKLIAKHGNTILRVFTIHVTSNWDKYIGYRNWMKNLEAEIWDSSMTNGEKIVAACEYIYNNFTYNIYSPLYTSYQTKEADCITATNILCDMAKLDLGLKVGYVNKGTKQIYSYLTGAISAADAHVYSAIYYDNGRGTKWWTYDCCPRRPITAYSY